MTRADIVQIIFGIHSDKMDTMKDLSRKRCKNYNDCADCDLNERDFDPLCPVFWTDSLVENEWKEFVRRFRILDSIYATGHNYGYLEGEKHQYELESEDTNDNY